MTPSDRKWFEIGLAVHRAYIPTLVGTNGRSEESSDLLCTDSGDPDASINLSITLRPIDPASSADTARRLTEFYASAPGGGYSIYDSWQRLDLEPHGFSRSTIVFMVREPGPPPADPPTGLSIAQVVDEAGLRTFGTIFAQSFGLEGTAAQAEERFVAVGTRDPRFRAWLGEVDDVPVTCAAAFAAEEATYLDFISTVPAVRGRGYARAVSWSAALTEPTHPAILHGGSMAVRIYESMGFRRVADVSVWTRPER